MDQLIFASLSHTHYWYEVGMLKVPAVVKLSQISLEYRRADHAIALQAASTGLASYLSDEPTTLHEAKVSPEWPQWRGALKREMDGQIARGAWKVVGRPKEKSYSSSRPFLNGRSARIAV